MRSLGKKPPVSRALVFALVAIVMFAVIGVAWLAVQWFVFGDTECDRGKCGPMGEFSDSVGLPGLFVIWAALAAGVALLAVRRHPTRHHERPHR